MSYQFSVQTKEADDGQRLDYEFVVDGDKLPRKLGDGTFGAVFEAAFSGSKRCAVKLFYPTQSKSVTETRNLHEMRAGSEVRRNLEDQRLGPLEANLVLADGWTTEFDKSEAHKSLSGAFGQLGISVSAHALVMPYYECTLKDVLETGAPKGRLVSGETVAEPGVPGYAILGNMSLPERERHVAGIVGQIVTGLWALHAAKLFHRDMKPANVMMRVVGQNVQVSLGDFGFLDDLPDRNGSGYGGALPLGTRHYRSPEQKDYFDLCDVKVSPADNASNNQLILETTDKKFADTLIEPGDIAEFSKDKHSDIDRETGHVVVSVSHCGEKSTIILENSCGEAFADEKTQVLFYKKPSGRTDLFGIGALIFDMLTLGKSPECFYDYLRPFDQSGANGSGVSVNAIVEKYRAAVNANATSADLAPIFEQVRDSVLGHYPSTEIMTVILRCMMSRSSGSYFDDAKQTSQSKLFRRILEDLAGLPSLRRHGEPSSAVVDAPPPFPTTNPLWKGEVGQGSRNDTGTSFEQGMKEIRCSRFYMKRFVSGAQSLSKICDAIVNVCQQKDFYVDIGPNNLLMANNDTEVRPILVTYRDEGQYLGAVLSGAAWSLEAGGATNNLIPLYMRFNIRAARVRLEETLDDHENISARAWFTESMPVWKGCAEGDFLRITDISGHSGLFAIQQIKRSGALLEMKAALKKSGDGFSLANADVPMDGLAIRRMDPVKCYLSMLATYLHHLFFVDDHTDTGVIPEETWNYLKDIIHGRPSAGVAPDIGKAKRAKFKFEFGSKKHSEIDLVRLEVAKLYLKLINLSERAESRDKARVIGEVRGDVDVILDRIAIMAGYKHRHDLLFEPKENLEEGQDGESENEDGKTFSDFLRDVLK